MSIKNVIFDVGNVLVHWKPLEVIQKYFPEFEPSDFYQDIRPVWIDLNAGKLTEQEAIQIYQSEFKLPKKQLTQFMLELKSHQTPIAGSIELLRQLKNRNFNLFSITNNVKEIMEHHRQYSEFPNFFIDIIVSAELGILKPNKQIYIHLLEKHALNPKESVFIDDILVNVEAAQNLGMYAIQFTDYESCTETLLKLIKI